METRRLTKEERLRLRRDFDRVFKEGRSVYNEFLRIVYANNSVGYRRIAVVVKKKIGKAVYRNRLRRLIKEVFRNNKSMFPESVDMVVIIREGLSDKRGIKYKDMLNIMRDLAGKML